MEQIEIKFTEKERHLILYHTFADPYLTKRLRIAEIKGKYLITKFTVEDLDDLIGYIAAEANHTEDTKLQTQLDKLFEKLRIILETRE